MKPTGKSVFTVPVTHTHPFMHRPRIILRWKLVLKFLSATGSNISVPNYWKCRGVGTALCYSNTGSLQVRFDRNVVFTSSTLLRASVSISLSIWRRGNYDMYKSQKGLITQYTWTLYCSLNWSFSCYSVILRLCWCSSNVRTQTEMSQILRNFLIVIWVYDSSAIKYNLFNVFTFSQKFGWIPQC